MRRRGFISSELEAVKNVLFILRDGTINSKFSTDQFIIDRFTNNFGFNVSVVENDEIVAADLTGKDLVWVSGSVSNDDTVTTNLAAVIKSSTLPIIVSRAAVQYKMDMASGNSVNAIGGLTLISMNPSESGNPVAAGQTGLVEVYSPSDLMNLGWDFGVNAVVIAWRAGFPSQAAIYYYNSGVEMLNSFVAPAKRGGFFVDKDANATAVVWDFFDALVNFMLT